MNTTERKIHIGRSRELLCAYVGRLDSEKVALTAALGRVLRETLLCDRDLPPFDRVTMDGIAVSWVQDMHTWQRVGTQFAGDAPLTLENTNQCVEVMTGAKLPQGTDTVIPIEWLDLENSRISLRPGCEVRAGQFVHMSGSDSCRGDLLLEPDTVLRGRHLAMAASIGKAELRVSRLPKVAYLSTGNELVTVAETPGEVQVRRSNDLPILAECAKLGIPLHVNLHLRDDPDLIEQTIRQLQKEVDLIVFSGGVSMGNADYIPSCAEVSGFQIIFHKVKQKPGGPVLFAKHPSGCLLLGLPGNPLSCMVCARVYLRQVFACMTGYPVGSSRIRVKGPYPSDEEKSRLLPVQIAADSKFPPQAFLVKPNTSGDLTRVLGSQGIVVIPPLGERASGDDAVFEYLDWET